MGTFLEDYYNKFNEEKRLTSRHGQIEFRTSIHYIHECIEELKREGRENIKIMDIGAGTGRYSVALAEEGFDVTAVELVKHNLGILKSKNSSVKAYQGNALKLKRFEDETFDITLLFGPMYHLFGQEDKVKALKEAARITRKGGFILVAYVMNEYGVITYAFKERHIKECMEQGRLTEDFHTISSEQDLYDYVRLEDITRVNEAAGCERVKIVTPDGPANYIRQFVNQLDEEEYEMFYRYHLATCERADLLGAADISISVNNTNAGYKCKKSCSSKHSRHSPYKNNNRYHFPPSLSITDSDISLSYLSISTSSGVGAFDSFCPAK